MARYVQINCVPYGSTGNVMFRTQEERLALGDECWAMWGRGRAAANDHEFRYGRPLGVYLDAALTRLDDRAGFHSKAATWHLLAKLDEIDPDVVHLHNLHGYHLNIEMLFDWLSAHRCQVLWTLHDCWAFTGHCSHFTYVGCEQWKTGCPGATGACPQKGEYPRSVLRDNCARNYQDKRRIFTSLPAERLTLITPSQWLADLVGQSLLSKYPVEIRPNRIDNEVFKPTPSDFRERHGIGNRFMVLGVASPWTERKGLGDFARLAQELDPGRFALVMVGLTQRQANALPQDIIALPRIDDPAKMAEAYTAADVFFNPSSEDNYPTTNLEAEACGTSVVCYDVGGCCETLRDASSCVVARYDEVQQALLSTCRRQGSTQ